MKHFLLVSLLGSILFTACKKDTTTVDMHEDYYGLIQGRYVIYDVTSISHFSGTQHDTVQYQLKTVIGDTIHDNMGRECYKFMRYKRNTASDPWQLSDVWMSLIADYRAELIEENQRVIKLVFAPIKNKSWNANAYNVYDELECYYDELHKSYTVGATTFDSTLTVEQDDELNLIEYRRKYEVYAKGVGLVKKYYRDLNINNFDVTDINEGKELFMNVVSYGME